MDQSVLINGQAINSISISDRGLQYGDGLFETLAIYQSDILCWPQHRQRLLEGCKKLKIPLPDVGLLESEISLLSKDCDKAVVKIIITRGQGGRGYAPPENPSPNRIISLNDWPNYPAEIIDKGIQVIYCKLRYANQPLLAGIKHLNRLEQVMARAELSGMDAKEGLVFDHNNHVIEGTMTNLFIVKNEVLYTPDLSQCGVSGTIRQLIIEQATTLNIKQKVKAISQQELENADEIFLCNSIIGIWPVSKLENIYFKPGKMAKLFHHSLLVNHLICPI